MKKILLVLLSLFLLVGLGSAAALYFFVYRPATAYMASFSELQEIPKLEAQVQNRASFTPPSTGELTEDRVRRFLQAQQNVQAQLGQRLEQLDAKYRSVTRSDEGASSSQLSLPDALRVLKDLSGLIVEAKRAQVDALNQHGFSLAEYEWTRHQIYAAASIAVPSNLADIVRDVAAGREPESPDGADETIGRIPARNRELVRPHLQELTERVSLVFVGL